MFCKSEDHISRFLQIGVLCKKDEDNIDHLFVYYSFSFKVWARILMDLDLVWMTAHHLLDLFDLEHGLGWKRKADYCGRWLPLLLVGQFCLKETVGFLRKDLRVQERKSGIKLNSG